MPRGSRGFYSPAAHGLKRTAQKGFDRNLLVLREDC